MPHPSHPLFRFRLPVPFSHQPSLLRNPRIHALALIAGLSLSVAGALWIRQAEINHTALRLEAEAALAHENIAETLQSYRELLLGFRGLLGADPDPAPQAFHNYFEALQIASRHPGILSVTYGLDVPDGGIPALEASLRRRTANPGLALHRPGPGGMAFILTLAEPGGVNRGVLGFDTRTVPGNSRTIERARDLGDMVVSGPTKVIQYAGSDPGVLLRMPIYQGTPRNLDERRRTFLGCVTFAARTQAILEEALTTEILSRVDIQVEDAGYSDREEEVPRSIFGAPLQPGGRRLDKRLDAFGRTWVIHFRARPAFIGSQEWTRPAAFGIAGALITLLLAGLLRSMSHTGRRARLLAERMMDQLREEESRMEAVTRAVPDPLAILDEEGRFLRIYAQQETVLGVGREDLENRHLAEVLPEGAAGPLLASIHKALETGRLQTAVFAQELPSGRSEFEGRLLAMGMAEAIDGRRCVVLSLRDITERTRAEEIARTKQKLESLGVLAGGIAHDFNNFLTAILGHLNLAQESIPEDSRAALMLKRAEASVLRAAELTHQMLAYSGRGSLKVENLDLNRVVREMTELLSVSITKKAALRFELARDLPRILADAVQIQQVVMNLVTNASDALGEGVGTITIETRTQHAGPLYLETRYPGQGLDPGAFTLLAVEDTGCGMDAETRKRIFDPFFTTKSTGRGLGLSALLGILRSHGAGISIQSEPGKGSRFEILFPVAPGSADQAPDPGPRAAEDHPLSGHALVADDEPSVRAIVAGILERRGLEVEEAVDGQEAVEIFRKRGGRFDLVLLDITMPRLDGNEAFRIIREMAPGMPVIQLSGFTRRDVAQAPEGTAPAVFVQKPFRAAELEEAVRKVLRKGHG